MSSVGVILDSGDVLLRPVAGRWFPPPAFEQILHDRGIIWDPVRLQVALTLGGQYLDDIHRVPLADEHAERAVWLRYYGIVLDALKLPDDSVGLAETITSAWEQQPGVEPCPWTRPVLAELDRRGVPVVVLSDAWPSLRRQYRDLGLARYVQAMVISGEEGVTKPDPRAFAKATALLGDSVESVYFVDDSEGHVKAAIRMGMRGFRLRPPNSQTGTQVPELSDLRELLAYL